MFNSKTKISKISKISKIFIIIIIAAALRILYARDIPLSGDEVIALLEASGQAVVLRDQLPSEVVSLDRIKSFINYSEDFSIKDIFASLRHTDEHPPFYFLFLHYVLRYIGDSVFILRLVSIFISLLSVLCMYCLGTRVYNEDVGWCSALLLAISPYGVAYASMVRFYPLAMLLSLASTYYVYELTKKGNLNLKNRNIYLYAIFALMGLYTINHFVFVFSFQIVLLIISNFQNRKALFNISIVTGIILVLFLPWIPSLLYQIEKGAWSHTEIFQGGTSLLFFVKYITLINFTRYIPGGSFGLVSIFINVIIYILIIIGCYYSIKNGKTRIFFLGLTIYILFLFAGDKILGARTLNIGRFFFLIMPISIMLLAVGISSITKRYYLRTMLVSFCCGLMLHGSIVLCNKLPPSYDGPLCTFIFPNTIDKFLKENQKGLILINTAQRRYLLSLAHAIKDPVDIKIIHSNNVKSELPGISNLRDYDLVFSANCYVPYEKQSFFSAQDIRYILDYLAKNGYKLVEPTKLFYVRGLSSLMAFEKKL